MNNQINKRTSITKVINTNNAIFISPIIFNKIDPNSQLVLKELESLILNPLSILIKLLDNK